MDWRRALLRKIGAPASQENLTFLSTWQRWEGGHTNNSAKYNWLNTTHGPGTSINSVGVKAFHSFKEGINALAETLHNGRYPDLLSAFTSGNPYAANPSAGLQTWVSGKPDGNPGYAQKILGGYSGGTARRNHDVPLAPPSMEAPEFDPDFKLAKVLFGFDKQFLNEMKSMRKTSTSSPVTATPYGLEHKGKTLVLPTSWKGTHVTDGLGWGTSTAEDIMGSPGTPVGAPEAGTVVYFHPTGAQGGGSMLIRTKSGREYWLGHIADGVKPGTKVKRGQVVAYISGDHAAPHVHIDRRG